MRSITVAVIIAGVAVYWGGSAAPTVPIKSQSYISVTTEAPPLSSEPDDDEDENRVRSKPKRRAT